MRAGGKKGVAIQGDMRASCDGNILFLDCVDVNILVVIYYGFAMLPLGETRSKV